MATTFLPAAAVGRRLELTPAFLEHVTGCDMAEYDGHDLVLHDATVGDQAYAHLRLRCVDPDVPRVFELDLDGSVPADA